MKDKIKKLEEISLTPLTEEEREFFSKEIDDIISIAEEILSGESEEWGKDVSLKTEELREDKPQKTEIKFETKKVPRIVG